MLLFSENALSASYLEQASVFIESEQTQGDLRQHTMFLAVDS